MSLSELEQVLEQAKTSPGSKSRETRRKVYSLLENSVLSPKASQIEQFAPSLDFVVYTISTILSSPGKLLSGFPDVLNLLATVEFYRNHTINKVKDALIWQRYYKQEKPMLSLSASEERTLSVIERDDTKMRKMYLRILQSSMELDLYWLWTGKVPQISEFSLRLNEYFPQLNPRATEDKNLKGTQGRLFHQDLTAEESQALHQAGEGCCRFAQNAVEWAQTSQPESPAGDTFAEAFNSKEFRESYPPPCPEERLAEAILGFINSVSKAAKTVQQIFGKR